MLTLYIWNLQHIIKVKKVTIKIIYLNLLEKEGKIVKKEQSVGKPLCENQQSHAKKKT